MAEYLQPAPGGSNAPGYFFVPLVILIPVTAWLFTTEYFKSKWICLVACVFLVPALMTAWFDCQGGGTCPQCGKENTVYWWSF